MHIWFHAWVQRWLLQPLRCCHNIWSIKAQRLIDSNCRYSKACRVYVSFLLLLLFLHFRLVLLILKCICDFIAYNCTWMLILRFQLACIRYSRIFVLVQLLFVLQRLLFHWSISLWFIDVFVSFSGLNFAYVDVDATPLLLKMMLQMIQGACEFATKWIVGHQFGVDFPLMSQCCPFCAVSIPFSQTFFFCGLALPKTQHCSFFAFSMPIADIENRAKYAFFGPHRLTWLTSEYAEKQNSFFTREIHFKSHKMGLSVWLLSHFTERKVNWRCNYRCRGTQCSI